MPRRCESRPSGTAALLNKWPQMTVGNLLSLPVSAMNWRHVVSMGPYLTGLVCQGRRSDTKIRTEIDRAHADLWNKSSGRESANAAYPTLVSSGSALLLLNRAPLRH